MPNFLILGAAKAGTTSVFHYLNQHPEIYMSPVKEPRFFAPEFYQTYCHGLLRSNARKTNFTLAEYQSLFAGVSDEVAIGEASTEYLYFSETPKRIKQTIPNAKLIAILRNPIERAYSAFSYQVRDGCETLSFERALQNEAKRIENKWRPGWHYKECGFYYTQLKRYFDVFESEQIRVYLYENLKIDPLSFVRDIYRFLEVDPSFVPILSRKNTSYIPKNKYINSLIVKDSLFKSTVKNILPSNITQAIAKKVKIINISSETKLNSKVRQQLLQAYKKDILELENLLQKDLSLWLEKS